MVSCINRLVNTGACAQESGLVGGTAPDEPEALGARLSGDGYVGLLAKES